MMTSHHDLYITTEHLPRQSIFNLSYGYEVTCTRVGGWKLWKTSGREPVEIAGEYSQNGLRLDVAGHVIVDSLSNQEKWIDQR